MSSAIVFYISCYDNVFFPLHLLGLAGVSRQEEGQKGLSRGDDIFGNGKHQVALSIQLTENVLRTLANILSLMLIENSFNNVFSGTF